MSRKKPAALIIGKVDKCNACLLVKELLGRQFVKITFYREEDQLPPWKQYDAIFFTEEGYHLFKELVPSASISRQLFVFTSKDSNITLHPNVNPLELDTEKDSITSLDPLNFKTKS